MQLFNCTIGEILASAMTEANQLITPRLQSLQLNLFLDIHTTDTFVTYECRSINKLQNGAIPLILKIGKIRNISFVGICNFEHAQKFF